VLKTIDMKEYTPMRSPPLSADTENLCNEVIIALRKIIRSIELHSRSLLKRIGLTGPQLITLREIDKRTETSAGDLAQAVSLGQATITGILERLENRNLIIRRRSESDRRKVQLQTTPAGKALLADTPPLMQESFVEALDELEDWEKTMILASLQRLVALMDARRLDAAPMLTTGSLESMEEAATSSFEIDNGGC
jgi:DNA-binding MarR family transcriptional regulator